VPYTIHDTLVGVLQCITVCCSVLQAYCRVLHMYLQYVPRNNSRHTCECVAVSCSVLQGVLHVVLCCIYLARVLQIRISHEVTDVKTCHAHNKSIGCVISHIGIECVTSLIDIECVTSLIYLKASYAFIETLRV